jgi:hypothetical protein
MPGKERVVLLIFSKVEDVQFGSIWQDGPAWLVEDRAKWSVSRDFVRKIPEEEKSSLS